MNFEWDKPSLNIQDHFVVICWMTRSRGYQICDKNMLVNWFHFPETRMEHNFGKQRTCERIEVGYWLNQKNKQMHDLRIIHVYHMYTSLCFAWFWAKPLGLTIGIGLLLADWIPWRLKIWLRMPWLSGLSGMILSIRRIWMIRSIISFNSSTIAMII